MTTPPCEFFIGTNSPNWLKFADFALFVSQTRLGRYKNLFPAVTNWALDSGAFTEISTHGEFKTTPRQYACATMRYASEIGRMQWASIQDWMCEDFILQKTGLGITEHQERTVTSYLTLCDLAPDVHWTPVLQGFTTSDYLRSWERYEAAGVDMLALPLVGVGSVCRRQDTKSAAAIINRLSAEGLKLHGFGIKEGGLCQYAHLLTSADSMAWSLDARWSPGKWQDELGCSHRSCSTCPLYAAKWRGELFGKINARCAGQWSLAI